MKFCLVQVTGVSTSIKKLDFINQTKILACLEPRQTHTLKILINLMLRFSKTNTNKNLTANILNYLAFLYCLHIILCLWYIIAYIPYI